MIKWPKPDATITDCNIGGSEGTSDGTTEGQKSEKDHVQNEHSQYAARGARYAVRQYMNKNTRQKSTLRLILGIFP